MVSTGTFLELRISGEDNIPIPVLCGRCSQGWFICLPDHEAGFLVDDPGEIDTDTFKMYLSYTDAEPVAKALRHAFEMMAYCKGGEKWVQKRWKKRKTSTFEIL